MKKLLLVLFVMTLVLSIPAMAQTFTDILGPHNLKGAGCVTCHAPHTGSKGLGGTDASTGVTYLWGRDLVANTYTTFGDGSLTTTTSYTDTDPLFHTGACLSCHDGTFTQPSGMTGNTVETLPENGASVPTYLNDSTYSLSNDHPVHVAYNCGGFNWDCTISASGTITWTVTDSYEANFNNTYGHPIRFYGVAGTTTGTAYVECSTCHNPHSMNAARYKNGTGTVLYEPSYFFVRGWYDRTNTASNSTTQFCRSCHYSKSNEYVHINSTTN